MTRVRLGSYIVQKAEKRYSLGFIENAERRFAGYLLH